MSRSPPPPPARPRFLEPLSGGPPLELGCVFETFLEIRLSRGTRWTTPSWLAWFSDDHRVRYLGDLHAQSRVSLSDRERTDSLCRGCLSNQGPKEGSQEPWSPEIFLVEPGAPMFWYLEPWIFDHSAAWSSKWNAMEPWSPDIFVLEPWSPVYFRPEPWSPKSLWDSK